jgi:Tfp pilus assembly protein PilN
VFAVIDVNLVADRERARRLGELAGRIMFFVALAAFIAAMVTISWQQTKLRSLRLNIAAIRTDVEKLQAQKADVDAVQRRLDSQRPLVDLLRSARDSEAKWCQALANIYQSLPPDVTLISARSSKTLRPRIKEEGAKAGAPVEREGFTLIGQAASGNLVGQFITNLQGTPSFKDVYLQYTRKRGGGQIAESTDFEIQALLPGKGGTKR